MAGLSEEARHVEQRPLGGIVQEGDYCCLGSWRLIASSEAVCMGDGMYSEESSPSRQDDALGSWCYSRLGSNWVGVERERASKTPPHIASQLMELRA